MELATENLHLQRRIKRSLFVKSLDEGMSMHFIFRQKHNAIIERVRLHRRSQQEDETVQDYADILKGYCSAKVKNYFLS